MFQLQYDAKRMRKKDVTMQCKCQMFKKESIKQLYNQPIPNRISFLLPQLKNVRGNGKFLFHLFVEISFPQKKGERGRGEALGIS